MSFSTEPNDIISEAYEHGSFPRGVGWIVESGYIGDENTNPAEQYDYGDVDLFRVDLQRGDRLVVTIDAYEMSGLDSYLRLFDANGTQISANDDSAWYGFDSYLDLKAPTSGVYYIGLSSYANGYYNPAIENSGSGFSVGSYNIWVNIDPNRSPIAYDDTLSGEYLPNTTAIIPRSQILWNDYDDDSLQISQVFSSSTAVVQLNDVGDIVFTPNRGVTTAAFDYVLTDPFGASSNRATVSVNMGVFLQGSNRADRLYGTEEADRIEGLKGDDSLVGYGGNDLIYGGEGRDILNGGYGRDTLVGGADADTYIIGDSGYYNPDTVVLERFDNSDLKAPDVIDLRSFNYTSFVVIDMPGAMNVGEIYNWRENLTASSLRERDVKQLLEVSDPFTEFHNRGATFFQYNNRTFLAVDNGDGSFSARNDSVIEFQLPESYSWFSVEIV
jgi:Ca2+-binding RTX toxin-like protein